MEPLAEVVREYGTTPATFDHPKPSLSYLLIKAGAANAGNLHCFKNAIRELFCHFVLSPPTDESPSVPSASGLPYTSLSGGVPHIACA